MQRPLLQGRDDKRLHHHDGLDDRHPHHGVPRKRGNGVLAPHELARLPDFAQVGPHPPRLLARVLLPPLGADRRRERLVVVEDLVVPQDEVRERTVVGVVPVLAPHGRVDPVVHHGEDARPPVRRKASGQAAHGAEYAFGRLHDLVREVVPHVLHPREHVDVRVLDVAVAGDAAHRRVHEALHQLVERTREDEGVRIHAHHELAAREERRHPPAVAEAAVLLEIHQHEPRMVRLRLLDVDERIVRGAVVDAHDLKLVQGIARGEDALQGLADRQALVETRHQHRQRRLEVGFGRRLVEGGEDEARDHEGAGDDGVDRHERLVEVVLDAVQLQRHRPRQQTHRGDRHDDAEYEMRGMVDRLQTRLHLFRRRRLHRRGDRALQRALHHRLAAVGTDRWRGRPQGLDVNQTVRTPTGAYLHRTSAAALGANRAGTGADRTGTGTRKKTALSLRLRLRCHVGCHQT